MSIERKDLELYGSHIIEGFNFLGNEKGNYESYEIAEIQLKHNNGNSFDLFGVYAIINLKRKKGKKDSIKFMNIDTNFKNVYISFNDLKLKNIGLYDKWDRTIAVIDTDLFAGGIIDYFRDDSFCKVVDYLNENIK